MFKKFSLFALAAALATLGTANAQVTSGGTAVTTATGFGITIDWGAIITSTATTYWLWIGAAIVPLFGFLAVKGGFRWVFGTVKGLFGARR